MNSDKRHIPQVIERENSELTNPITRGGRRIELSPREALYYNEHPGAIIEDFDRSEYGGVLREIERHVIEWEDQQTPAQAEWVAQTRRRHYRSPLAGARAILAVLQA